VNDGYDTGYGGGGYELVGYDDYGRPVYRQVPAQHGSQQTYDPYGGQEPQAAPGRQDAQGYGYDPYAAGAGQQHQPYDAYQQPYQTHDTPGGYGGTYDPYGTQAAPGAAAHTSYDQTSYDTYGQPAPAGQQPQAAGQTAYVPRQPGPEQQASAPRSGTEQDTERTEEPEYRTEQFAFVEEPDDDSEDVIDWLKFTENRTERREEARRRARNRLIALAVVLALAVIGGVGYLAYAGKLPGLSSSGGQGGSVAAGAQKRDVIVVHLHDTANGGTMTALLVDNTTTKQGATVLLPNSLALTADDGTTTTLAKSVQDDGSTGTREQLDTVLGTSIQGTWRLDTPYLQNLVDLVGGIEADTDTDVPDPDAGTKDTSPLVHQGKDQSLSGRMAVAYATYRAPGESSDAELKRFGQVMQGVLRKMSSDPDSATVTVQTLAQILDPSLTDKDLGTFLAGLSDLAKGGDYRTTLLPVQSDGTLSAQTSESVVKPILGGTAKSPEQGAAVRVTVRNATGSKDSTEQARVTLLNGGFTVLEGGTADARAASQVIYADAADKENATEVAKTLGLPDGSVTKGTTGSGADVLVVLGQDYKPASDG
jgi:anionic cell wall polymer biosynthesis LytR-Cps2A-Psr (LCP) family protein